MKDLGKSPKNSAWWSYEKRDYRERKTPAASWNSEICWRISRGAESSRCRASQHLLQSDSAGDTEILQCQVLNLRSIYQWLIKKCWKWNLVFRGRRRKKWALRGTVEGWRGHGKRSGRRWSILVPHAKGEWGWKIGDQDWQFRGHQRSLSELDNMRRDEVRPPECVCVCGVEGGAGVGLRATRVCYFKRSLAIQGRQELEGMAKQKRGYFGTRDHAAGLGTNENWGLEASGDRRTREFGKIKWS